MEQGNDTPTLAYVLIKVEVGKDEAKHVAEQVAALGAVMQAAVVTGPYDVVAEVLASDNMDLGNVVVGEIHGIPGVAETVTGVVTYHAGGPGGIQVGP